MKQKRSALQERKMVVAVVLSLVVLVIASAAVTFYPNWRILGLPAASCQPLPEGAVSWFNGEKISGSPLPFFVDKLNNNVALGSADSVAGGKVGNAFSFSDVTSVAHSTGGLNTEAGTLEMWVKPNWNGEDDQLHGLWQLGVVDDIGDNGHMFLAKSGSNQLGFLIQGLGISASVTTAAALIFQPGVWRHLVVAWDHPNSNLKLYVDGIMVESTSNYFFIELPPLLTTGILGKAGFILPGQPVQLASFNGLIDEVRLYNRALEETEILQLFQSGSLGACPFESNCADGEDDDDDGNIDCNDADCVEHPACGSALETGAFCHNGVDDDDDDFIDCFDSSCFLDNIPSALGNGDGVNNCFDQSCYTDAQCLQETCLTAEGTVEGAEAATVGEVVWSYQLPSETSTFLDHGTPAWNGCCPANYCWYGDDAECLPVSSREEQEEILCDTDLNWHACEQDGQLSSNGFYECSLDKWRVRCSEQTKYWLENGNTELCDGENWRTCEDFLWKPIADLDVQVSCVGNTITIKEKNCNNANDDDNDGKADGEDNDCQDTVDYMLGHPWYEIRMKATDLYRLLLQRFVEE